MSVFVGLDCGGSSTRLLAVDSTDTPIHQGHSGAANLVSTHEGRLRRHLEAAARGCPSADYVCGCFAGLVSEDLRQRALGHLRELFPGARLRAEPDYLAVYYSAPEGTDVCVIAGTGSLVFSLDGQGNICKSGGRGYLLGDAGSGYRYGRDALNHYLDNPLGASRAVSQAVQEQFRTNDPNEVVANLYRSAAPAATISKLARSLATDARNGVTYALESVDRNTQELASIVATHVVEKLEVKSSLSLCLAGGVWKAAPNFMERFTFHLQSMLSGRALNIDRVARPPLYGAVELAKQIQHGN